MEKGEGVPGVVVSLESFGGDTNGEIPAALLLLDPGDAKFGIKSRISPARI